MSEVFQVTARKWRPMRFEDVVGQEHITRTLKNAIAGGRLAHAFLFTGQRGCGKTTVARLLAKAINCPNAAKNDYEPCNSCENCRAITDGRSMDVAEIDGASNNSVDDVRGLRENVKYPPLQGEYKVIIIDEVHMLSTSAFNALLKTLEEPPSYLIFIFATTEVQKVLPTILSRTQRYDFRRIQIDEITALLRKIADADGITIDDDALLMIAKKADGSARDAESIFDQAVAYCGMNVETARLREALALIDLDFYFDVTAAITSREAKRAFELAAEVMSRGYDIEEFLSGLLDHLRNVLTVLITRDIKLVEVSKAHAERYRSSAKDFTEGDIIRLVRIAQQALEKLQFSSQPRIVLEVALVEMMLMERAVEIGELLQAIRALGGRGPLPVAGGPAVSEVAPQKKSSDELKPASETIPLAAPTIAAPSPRPAATPATRSPRTPDDGPPTTSANDIAPEVIASRWAAFAEFLKTKSRPLYSIMPEIELVGVRRSTIYLAASGAEKNMLSMMKDEMQIALREFFGIALAIEAGNKADMQAKSGSPILAQPVANAVQDTTVNSDERTELEKALIEKLGAQQVG